MNPEVGDGYKVYAEAHRAFETGGLFCSKKFSEAELSFKQIEYASKSSMMVIIVFTDKLLHRGS